MPKFWKGHNSGKIRWFFFNLIYSSSPISWPSFKPLAKILFEISYWQDFILIFSKGHNSRKGDNSVKKKKCVSAIFPWGIHIWNLKILACMVHKIWHACFERAHGQPETNMPCQLQSWGHKKRKTKSINVILDSTIKCQLANISHLSENETKLISRICFLSINIWISIHNCLGIQACILSLNRSKEYHWILKSKFLSFQSMYTNILQPYHWLLEQYTSIWINAWGKKTGCHSEDILSGRKNEKLTTY